MSTTSSQHADAFEQTVKVIHHFGDDQYVLAAVQLGQDDYVFLYDAGQRALFLGQQEQAIALRDFWKKHREDARYCMTCELMLCFEERWIAVPGELPLELGIDTDTAARLLDALKDEITFLRQVEINAYDT